MILQIGKPACIQKISFVIWYYLLRSFANIPIEKFAIWKFENLSYYDAQSARLFVVYEISQPRASNMIVSRNWYEIFFYPFASKFRFMIVNEDKPNGISKMTGNVSKTKIKIKR